MTKVKESKTLEFHFYQLMRLWKGKVKFSKLQVSVGTLPLLILQEKVGVPILINLGKVAVIV
jgi:hypothetical protein